LWGVPYGHFGESRKGVFAARDGVLVTELVGLAGAGVGTYAWSVTTTAERQRDARVKTDSALACVLADPGLA
jgi:hypothetical protein